MAIDKLEYKQLTDSLLGEARARLTDDINDKDKDYIIEIIENILDIIEDIFYQSNIDENLSEEDAAIVKAMSESLGIITVDFSKEDAIFVCKMTVEYLLQMCIYYASLNLPKTDWELRTIAYMITETAKRGIKNNIPRDEWAQEIKQLFNNYQEYYSKNKVINVEKMCSNISKLGQSTNIEYMELIPDTEYEKLIPTDFSESEKNYISTTISNFVKLAGEGLSNDEENHFSNEQIVFMNLVIAALAFYKSVDIIKAGIPNKHWDGIMQRLAFTVYEVIWQAFLRGYDTNKALEAVEHHVKETYKNCIEKLYNQDLISEEVNDLALKHATDFAFKPDNRDITMQKDNSRTKEVFRKGDLVTHEKYGNGIVEQVIIYGYEKSYCINFEKCGGLLIDPSLTQIKKI